MSRRQRRRVSFTEPDERLRLLKEVGRAVVLAPLELYRAILRVELEETKR